MSTGERKPTGFMFVLFLISFVFMCIFQGRSSSGIFVGIAWLVLANASTMLFAVLMVVFAVKNER